MKRICNFSVEFGRRAKQCKPQYTIQRYFGARNVRSFKSNDLPAGVLSYDELPQNTDNESDDNSGDECDKRYPLLALHGLFGMKNNLKSVALRPIINNHHSCFCLDLRNHGDSFNAADMKVCTMAEDVIRTMDHLGIEKASWLGHSMGGRVAMVGALHYPQRCAGVIVADVAPVDYGNWKIPIYRKLLTNLDSIPTTGWKLRDDILKLVKPRLPELTTFELNFLLSNFVPNTQNKGEWYWKTNLTSIKSNIEDLQAFPYEGRYEGPSFFIGGAKSEYLIPDKHSAHILELFPNAHISMIEDASHMLHIDQPMKFAERVEEALEAIDRWRRTEQNC